MTDSVLTFREAAKEALAHGTSASELTRMVTDLDAPDLQGERLSGVTLDGPTRTVEETYYVVTVSGTDADVVTEEVGGIIEFVANRDDSDVTTSTTGPFTRTVDIEDELIESPSGWCFRASQENGDNVDCKECGNTLNDDQPIYSNKEGYAFCSEECILADHDHGETLHAYNPAGEKCGNCGDAVTKDTTSLLLIGSDGEVHCPGTQRGHGPAEPDNVCTCGDTEEGLMHNNTERNIEPLLWEDEGVQAEPYASDQPVEGGYR